MQSVLVVSKTQGVYPAFRKILEPQCRLEKARSIYDALENLSKESFKSSPVADNRET